MEDSGKAVAIVGGFIIILMTLMAFGLTDQKSQLKDCKEALHVMPAPQGLDCAGPVVTAYQPLPPQAHITLYGLTQHTYDLGNFRYMQVFGAARVAFSSTYPSGSAHEQLIKNGEQIEVTPDRRYVTLTPVEFDRPLYLLPRCRRIDGCCGVEKL